MTYPRYNADFAVKILCLLFVPVVTLNKTIIHLDTSEDRNCGGIYNISSENEISLVASGRLHGGTCAVTFRTDNHSSLKCGKICIKMTISQLQTCDMKMLFVPVVFDKSKVENPKSFDCRSPFPDAWCPSADVLYVLLTESNRYPRTTENHYKFEIDVTPQCVTKRDKTKEREAKISYTYHEKKSVREKWIYIEGVIVSICLASIFLVALVVLYCYYKAQKENGPSRSDVPKSSSKKPILSNVRSKLPFRSHKRKSHDSARSSESYQKIMDTDQNLKPDVEVSDIMQDRTDSASTLVVGLDNKRVAENQV
ncbi:uncharacterized protein LOC133194413 [Saccostrea echinata]|uniref:uncharacterized protein LOC133194413 n=1 Tax=Saccostrea echinata TaxID=191078 RepID=UPI002A805846|nr:uncharacterized protein LOC133194413 [Saccostrea echinata]